MKKILTISPDYHPSKGGVEKYLYDIHLSLSKTFYNHVFAGTRISDKKNISYKLNNINVIKRRTYKFFGLDFLFNPLDFYILFLQIKNADIVWVNDVKFVFFFSTLISFLYKKKLVLTTHGLVFHNQRYKIFKIIFVKIYLFIIKNFVTEVVSNGQTDLDYLFLKKIKSRLINNGVDLSKFKIKRKPMKNNFLYFGRIDKNKGFENLINCLKEYKLNTSDKFVLNVLGSAEKKYLNQLKLLIKKNDLINNICFFGRFTDELLIKNLEKSEFVLNSSTYESFGITLIESLASGSTVIASNNKQFQLMHSGSNAFYLFDYSNPSMFPKMIKNARSEFKANNLKAISFSKRYSFDKHISKYKELFNE